MNRFTKAFTLAEGIVVLTLLGVLAAIVIPSTINNTRNKHFVTKAKKHIQLYPMQQICI